MVAAASTVDATAAMVAAASTVDAPWLKSASLMVLIKATASLNSSVAAAILLVSVATASAAFAKLVVFLLSSSLTSESVQTWSAKSLDVRSFRIATIATALVGL